MRLSSVLTRNGTSSVADSGRAIPASTGKEVFALNLIRTQDAPTPITRALAWAGIAWVAANVAVVVALTAAGTRAIRERVALQIGAPAAPPSTDALASLHAQALARLHDLTTALAAQRHEFPLGGKLAAVTRTLPARTWLTELIADRPSRVVRIRARYWIDPERSYEAPTAGWIDALKADPQFAAGLKRLEPGPSSRESQGGAEVLAFELIAEWESN